MWEKAMRPGRPAGQNLMGKKRNLLALPAAAVIVCCLLSGLASPEPQEQAGMLIKQRAQIMSNVQTGTIAGQEAAHQLRQVESDSLLEEDLQELQALQALEKPSDRVAGMLRNRSGQKPRLYDVRLLELTQKKQLYQYITYEAEILWDWGSSLSVDRYHLALQQTGPGWRLTVLEPENKMEKPEK